MPCGQQVKKYPYSGVRNFTNEIALYTHLNIFNREAIDVFFAARVAREKGLRLSASVSRLK